MCDPSTTSLVQSSAIACNPLPALPVQRKSSLIESVGNWFESVCLTSNKAPATPKSAATLAARPAAMSPIRVHRPRYSRANAIGRQCADHYDPYLAAYLNGSAGRELARQSGSSDPCVQRRSVEGIPLRVFVVTDVAARFSTDDLNTSSPFPGLRNVPMNDLFDTHPEHLPEPPATATTDPLAFTDTIAAPADYITAPAHPAGPAAAPPCPSASIGVGLIGCQSRQPAGRYTHWITGRCAEDGVRRGRGQDRADTDGPSHHAGVRRQPERRYPLLTGGLGA